MAQGARSFVIAIMAMLLFVSATRAQDVTVFRIGTGGVTGTYYQIGGVIADAISNPPGDQPCERGGDCGVPGLVAIAQTSGGSVANLVAISRGHMESGFAQSDTSFDATHQQGAFSGDFQADNVRSIAALFPEQLQLVVHKESGIAGIADLRGKRVSLDTEDSGTIGVVRDVLAAFDISEDHLHARYVKSGIASGELLRGELDAFFIMAGTPTPSVQEALLSGEADLIGINGAEIDALLEDNPSYSKTMLHAYGDFGEVSTIGVQALWLVDANVSDELVLDIATALFHPETIAMLDALPNEVYTTPEDATRHLVVPLHPGALKYYEKVLEALPTD